MVSKFYRFLGHLAIPFTINHKQSIISDHLFFIGIDIQVLPLKINKNKKLSQTHRYSHETSLFISNEGNHRKVVKRDIVQGADPRVFYLFFFYFFLGGAKDYVSASILRARNDKCLSPGPLKGPAWKLSGVLCSLVLSEPVIFLSVVIQNVYFQC